MASDITFYWGSGSPFCWRVMMALEEKGLKYDSKLLSFEKKEHKCAEVLALNPRGQLPTMKVGDVVINESIAAMAFLEKQYRDHGNRLIPDGVKECAVALQRVHEVMAANDKLFNEYAKYLRSTKPEDRDAAELAERKKNLLEELDIWEGYLKGQDYIAGSTFTMADCMFFPIVAFMVRLKAKVGSRYPNLLAYYDRLKQRPSIQASWPPHWKDSEGPGIMADLI